jgi:hypothetical protein
MFNIGGNRKSLRTSTWKENAYSTFFATIYETLSRISSRRISFILFINKINTTGNDVEAEKQKH